MPQQKDTRARDPSLDIARGLAIVLVVLGHALIGAITAGYDSAVARALVLMIYSSHMALFFAVSGLLSTGLAGQSWPRLTRRIGQRIAWPYVVWSLILLTAHWIMSGHTNLSVERFEPWTILWRPPAVMWFLHVLGGAMVLLRLLAPAGRRITVLAGIALAALAYAAPAIPLSLRFAGLFLIAAGSAPVRLDRPVYIALAALVMIATLWIALLDAQAPLQGYPAGRWPYIPALVAGPVLILWLSRGLAQGVWAGPLLYVGQRTMAIFTAHILVTAGVRIALRLAGVTAWWPIIVSATVLGVALPLAAQAVTDRLGWSRWIGWR